jgi:hypothetical protein
MTFPPFVLVWLSVAMDPGLRVLSAFRLSPARRRMVSATSMVQIESGSAPLPTIGSYFFARL